jgi:multiple sugar transport system ATP-binding protein
MTLADRIVVMRDGRILQVGAPMELYKAGRHLHRALHRLADHEHPAGLDRGRGRHADADPNLRVLADDETADLVLAGTAAVIEPLGSETFVHVEHGGGLILASARPNRRLRSAKACASAPPSRR